MNDLEIDIARAIDRTQRVWCRNPEGSGYFIPLLDRGSTATFWPDFLVWVDRTVVAVDTKGDHLISEDSRRKLFDIEGAGERARIVLCIITAGRWSIAPSGQLEKHGGDAYMVWRWSSGKLNTVYCPDSKAAMDAALAL